MSDLERLLGDTSPEALAQDPILRRAFIVALLASDFYLPVEETETEQSERGGVSLQAVIVNDMPHALMFSSEARLKDFCETGTRFARVVGNAVFPSLSGQFAILNPGPTGLVLTPEDMAEILGGSTELPKSQCGVKGHVHGPDCQH